MTSDKFHKCEFLKKMVSVTVSLRFDVCFKDILCVLLENFTFINGRLESPFLLNIGE